MEKTIKNITKDTKEKIAEMKNSSDLQRVLWDMLNLKRALQMCAVTLLMFVNVSQASYVPDFRFKVGTVMARSIVIDPATDEPILVRYNQDGTEDGEVNIPAQYPSSELSIVAAADYIFYKKQITDFNLQYQDTLAQGAELMSLDDFKQGTYMLADNQTTMSISGIASYLESGNIHSVLVRGQSNRIVNDVNQLVLLRFPLNMAQNYSVSESDTSLVVTTEGNIIAKSNLHIGYRTGFFGDPTEAQDINGYRIDPNEDTVFGPIAGVKVNVDEFAYPGGIDVSGADGRYNFNFKLPLCPVGGFDFTTDVWAELRYSNFMPVGSPSMPYFLRKQSWSFCFAQLIYPGFYQNVTPSSIPFTQHNMYVDVMFLTGRIGIKNINGANVAIGTTTTYSSFDDDADIRAQNFYDFNGDGQYDAVILGSIKTITNGANEQVEAFVPQSQFDDPDEDPELQGIFFDGQQNSPEEMPDVVRIADSEIRFRQTVGVLETISPEDMRNTDVLFFRESTGQLVMERRGLKEEEAERRKATRFDEETNEVAYRIMLRGPRDTSLNMGGGLYRERRAGFEAWTVANQLEEPFQARASDHLKSGEVIKIVAINRATGYVGTARARLLSAGDNGTTRLTVEVPTMTMRPPNLKVWAERKYDVEKGLTAGEERNYTIGSEGAALTSDTTVTIYTEWLDEYGGALPDGLGVDHGEQYGLTGRFAKVVAGSALQGTSAGADLAEFSIAPGRDTQVINVNSNLSHAEHYYIHVHGMAKDQECVAGYTCPDFSVTGASVGASDPYDTRPSLLTPFLVPLFNEDRHWQEYGVYRGLKRDYDPSDSGAIEPLKPLPAYSWQYRPEYQFSMFELEVTEIKELDEEDESANILVAARPLINTTSDLVRFTYSLISNQVDRLAHIDSEQELVLALGETEVVVTIGENQQINFQNLEHLTQISSEDLLTIRLYSNNDSGNILWEFAFETLDIDIDTDNDNGLGLPDRSIAEEEAESDNAHPGKVLDVNGGDINGNDIPDFAEFDYLDEEGLRVEMLFVPFIIQLPSHVDVSSAKVKFTYFGSDPLAIEVENVGTASDPEYVYTAAPGVQRIWVTNANEEREAEDFVDGGDYIKSQVQYDATDLGFTSYRREQIFYLEGIRRTGHREAQINVVVEYDQ